MQPDQAITSGANGTDDPAAIAQSGRVALTERNPFMSGINPVQGGPDRSTLSSTVPAAKASPADAARAKHVAAVKQAKLLAAKKLKLANQAKRAAQDAAAAKAALAPKTTPATTVDVLA